MKWNEQKLAVRIGLVFLLLVCVLPVTPVHAASTWTVTKSADSNDGTCDASDCSLREAITAAADGDSITFDSDHTIHLASTLTISKELTIDGTGYSVTVSGDSDSDGDGDVRVFNIDSSGTVTLKHLSITRGLSSNNGGGIANSGRLSVVDCNLTSNVGWVGGGIYNIGTLTVSHSTFSGNTTTRGGVGGAITNNSGGTATITDSTFTGNTGDDGGAIYNNTTTASSTLTITNSTLSGNTALGDYGSGGGITNTGVLTITNSTFTGNTSTYQGGGIANMGGTTTVENSTLSGNTASSQGGGIFNSSGFTVNVRNSTVSGNGAVYRGGGIDNHGILNLSNTIVANSTAGGDCRNSVTIIADHNLIEASGTNACDLTNGVNGNITGQDPLLGALANYGGDTYTFALLPGSPALEAGGSCLATDQRGIARPQPTGGACDIGSVEMSFHTVTFDSNLGSGSMTPQISSIATTLSTNTFTRTGFSFSGWNTLADGGGTAYADGAVYDFNTDLTLYAQWTALPNHTVTFDANNGTGSMSPQTTNVPTALTTKTYTRTGFSFSGWNTLTDGGGTAYTDGALYDFNADLTLYAQWTALPNHTVIFEANNGTGSMSPQTTNVPTALTTNTFIWTGYSFSGWNTLAGGGGTAYADGTVYDFTTDLTLYAQWTALPNHTVTFDANNGTGSMSPQTTNVPTALTTNTFTWTGFTFSGWNSASNGSGTSYADGATYSFTADLTLYAQWTDASAPTLLSISRQTPPYSSTNADTLVFLVSFDENVQNVDEADFVVNGTTTATIAEVSAVDDRTYEATVSGGDLASFNGMVGLNLAAGQNIQDQAGNLLPVGEPATDETYVLDNSIAVTSILRQNPTSSPTNSTYVYFRVTFSEDVQNVGPADFTLASSTAAGTINAVVVQSASVYDIVIISISGNGTIDLEFDPANNIADLVGNPIGATPTIGTEQNYVIDNVHPSVLFNGSTTPDTGSVLLVGPNRIIIAFNKNVLADGSTNAANLPANYLLVEDGNNGTFNTLACGGTGGGLQPDDVQITVNSVRYDDNSGGGPFLATLNINGGVRLPPGNYRLFICGTSSIYDLAGNRLNDGLDSVLNFSIIKPTSLPATGFAPGRATILPDQTVAYDESNLWLEIPHLDIRSEIVGVPATKGSWDVSWLGSSTGWLQGSAYPTLNGNSVLTGHVYDAYGKPGPFVNLIKLMYGDRILIHTFGQEYVYEVRAVEQVSADNIKAIMQHEDRPWLTLVTCRGYDEESGEYAWRYVVRAIQVKVEEE